jgi:hypothetical protein
VISKSLLSRLEQRLRYGVKRLQLEWRLLNLTRKVVAKARPHLGQPPVVMFNASTRLSAFSQNAAFALLTTWALQLAGIPVVQFACQRGMSRCVLGTKHDDPYASPPCEACIAQSRRLYASAPTHWFTYQPDDGLKSALQGLSIDELGTFEYPFSSPGSPNHGRTIPLGQLVLPPLRWALRRHHLPDDEVHRMLLGEFIQSAYRVAETFDGFLDQVNPSVVVVFNGIMFPEAAARWVAQGRGLRVITHEVGFQPFSTIFSAGQVTAYPIHIPDEFELTPEQNARLDAYLSQRFQGEFTMAGIRFWPEMSGLDDSFLARAAEFKQIVPVFTNVVFDTSQVHANVIFPHMFAWLELVLGVIREHPETLFVIRAHPDEERQGTRKHSRQRVSDWIKTNQVDMLPNVIFVGSNEPLSSYELMERSKFVIVYNSSIGLEAALMGVPVLCGGKARFTQYPTVFFPQSTVDYRRKAEEFLAAEVIEVPEEFQRNARRFLYFQLFRVSLPLDRFIEAHPTPGYVQLKRFSWRDLTIDQSETMRILVNGIVSGTSFLLPES